MTQLSTSPARRVATVADVAMLWTVIASIAVFDLPREYSAVGVAALILLPAATILFSTGRLIAADPIVIIGTVWILAVTAPILLPGLYKDRSGSR